MKHRLDIWLAKKGVVASRSQAESWVRMGKVTVNGRVITKPGSAVSETDSIKLAADEQYVSRAALKLKSADAAFRIDWKNKTVLDVGSSTGGFTEYALTHGASKVIAVDVGTDQLHRSLRTDARIELHEKTDIRDVWPRSQETRDMSRETREKAVFVDAKIDIVVGDVSFISLREILPHVSHFLTHDSIVIAMVKPQFEAGQSGAKHKGVIKNDRIRRGILKDFEMWVQKLYKIIDKKDSEVAGGKGNVERFYLLKKVSTTKRL